jgi:hypothetical protein
VELTRSKELVLLEKGKAILGSVVAAALERLVLDVTPEVLVQSRWVGLVHLVDLVGVFDSGDRCGDDDDHVVVGSLMSKVRVYAISSVFHSQAIHLSAATHASGGWPFASRPTILAKGEAWRT